MGGFTYVDFYYGDMITMALLIIGIVIVLYAQIKVNGTYKKYSKIKNSTGVDGFDTAKKILKAHNMELYIVKTPGELTDHYDPRNKTVKLSDGIYDKNTIAAVAVAAHECGHAIQDEEGYFFLRLRTFLVPIVNLINYLGYFIIFISIFAGVTGYFLTGIIIVLGTLAFQLVTLPVEFDASRRGLEEIQRLNLLSADEYRGAKAMLSAAAFTYVASTISSLLQLLRLIMMFRRRD